MITLQWCTCVYLLISTLYMHFDTSTSLLYSTWIWFVKFLLRKIFFFCLLENLYLHAVWKVFNIKDEIQKYRRMVPRVLYTLKKKPTLIYPKVMKFWHVFDLKMTKKGLFWGDLLKFTFKMFTCNLFLYTLNVHWNSWKVNLLVTRAVMIWNFFVVYEMEKK